MTEITKDPDRVPAKDLDLDPDQGEDDDARWTERRDRLSDYGGLDGIPTRRSEP